MKPAVKGSDPAFVGRPAAEEHLKELLEWARDKLGLGPDRRWELVSSRSKLKKTLFEIEETSPEGTIRMIGKVSRSERSKGVFAALTTVWEAGFRPPSLYTVVRPVAYFEERHLLLQEKAAGVQLLDLIRRSDEAGEEMCRRAARWLAALHCAPIEANPFFEEPKIVERCRAELERELPETRHRVAEIADCLERKLHGLARSELVPSHGDFHPLNVFLADSGRVSVIDFDTFSSRERASDVSYFLAQCALMGYLANGSFADTSAARGAFLEEYEGVAGRELERSHLGVYMGFAFLQSLHFERCILHTGNASIVDPWLSAAERTLNGDIHL